MPARAERSALLPADQPGGTAILETGLGWIGLAWTPAGVVGAEVPSADRAGTAEALARRFPGWATAAVPEAWSAALTAWATGELERLDTIPVALDAAGVRAVPPFHRTVYEALRAVPAGITVSYGELAARAGRPRGARAIGQAMARNPVPLLVPCHRVVAGDGPGGFSSRGGLDDKARLLEHERTHGRYRLPDFDRRRAARVLGAQDPRLGEAIAEIGPCGLVLERPSEVFPSLARAIIFQQLHGKAASTIYRRVAAAVGSPRLDDPRALQRIDDETLRAQGLSGAKLRALRDLAERTLSGELPSPDEVGTLDDDALVERLSVVRGVGRWTVEMMLIFRLGRPDVLPLGDFGVRRGFELLTHARKPPTPEALLKAGERWRPFRSVASWYLWRVADRAKDGAKG